MCLTQVYKFRSFRFYGFFSFLDQLFVLLYALIVCVCKQGRIQKCFLEDIRNLYYLITEKTHRKIRKYSDAVFSQSLTKTIRVSK